jgi:hypothetical protein
MNGDGQVVSRFDSARVSSLCELGPRPLVMTGWLRLWLEAHFQKGNLEDQDQTIQKMLWQAGATTGIMIESNTRWVPELTESRPAIILKRGAWQHQRLGIDNRMFGLHPPDGQEVYANLWQGSHTLFCIANKGAEVEKLGAEVYREMNEFGPAFREVLNLMRFECTEVGEIMILEEARQNFVVPVVVAYAFMEQWKLNREVPVLRTVDLTLFQQ